MIKDQLVNLLFNLFNKFGLEINVHLLYIGLYNFVPAFIFGPILIYKGYKYSDWFILIVGISLCIIDTIHLINNLKRLKEKGTIN